LQLPLRHTTVQMFGGPGGGSFLNLGGPEMVVIGACAWALLGPKELYRLANEAGKFLGEWQTLGLQAKQTFTDALESELREDELQKEEKRAAENIAKMEVDQPSPFAPLNASASQQFPTLAEMEQQRGSASSWYDDDKDGVASPAANGSPTPFGVDATMLEQMNENPAEFGVDQATLDKLNSEAQAVAATERSIFEQQISGETNRQVLEEFPSELSVEPDDEQARLETEIAQAENQLAMLRTEAKVLQLRRKQQEDNVKRNAREKELLEKLAASADEDKPDA